MSVKPPKWMRLNGKTRDDAILHDARLLWVIREGIDLSPSEIANLLGISLKTARLLISEAEMYRQGAPLTLDNFSFDSVRSILDRALAISTTPADYVKVATAVIAAIKANASDDAFMEVPEDIADKIN